MDRLTSLTVFVKVVECGGFSAAASRLNLSTTMVSSHIQSLESRLGTRLLNRTTRRMSLTETGKAYYERCLQILTDLEEADRVAGALQATPRGNLRLYLGTHLVGVIAPIVSEYLATYPQVSVDLSIGERMVALVEERFDVAIRPVPLPDSSLIVRKLAGWRHLLCCSPGYRAQYGLPMELTDLAVHNCLRYSLYPFGDEWRFVRTNGEPASIRVTGNLITNSAETLRTLALEGHGIFLGPSFLASEDVRQGRLVEILTDYRPVEFSINAIYPHRSSLSLKARSFIDLLAERLSVLHPRLNPPVAAD